jgi:hypothetical protein
MAGAPGAGGKEGIAGALGTREEDIFDTLHASLVRLDLWCCYSRSGAGDLLRLALISPS